jgi:hypothetical protein
MTRLDLNYLGRLRVVSPEPEIITLLGETMVIEPQVELTTFFVDDGMLAGPTFPNYPKLCAVNGVRVATMFFGADPIDFTARVAIFTDGGRASFPALILDDGRVIAWRNSTNEIRPTDRPGRADEMRALVAPFGRSH